MLPQKSFHRSGESDDMLLNGWGGPDDQRSLLLDLLRRRVYTERDYEVSFTLHQHPYVSDLAKRLLRGGTRGLQEADTLRLANGVSLPGSVQVNLPAGAALTVDGSARFTLTADITVGAGNNAASLTAGMVFDLDAAVTAVAPDGALAVLTGGTTATPAPGSDLAAGGLPASLPGPTLVVLSGPASFTLYSGAAAQLPAETGIVLDGWSRVVPAAGVTGVLVSSIARPVLFQEFFEAAHHPDPETVQLPYPVKDLDFSSNGAYAPYNWELFFHVPMTIAVHLSKNQRYADAQRWFHFLFDPTDDSDGPAPQRFWKVRPFQESDVARIEELLTNLATGADPQLRDDTIRNIENWRDAPFRPHLVARFRPSAYMYKTVMAYLDNLIDWGDSLFRQDTGEAIDEALGLYVLAAQILGPRPQAVPQKGTVRPQTYANLRKDLQEFGVVMRDVEADVPFDLMPMPAPSATPGGSAQLAAVRGLGKALYFQVPPNEQLIAYWDTVADRLFKIRNSLNLQGTFRQLAPFEPPIDPGMLVRATAAGLDIAAITSGLNQPLPLVRFAVLAAKATELAQEVKSLGSAMLAAIEKQDGEALALLRAAHERSTLEFAEQVRYGQLQEAVKNQEALLRGLDLALERYAFYERQLGRKDSDIFSSIPQLQDLNQAELAALRLRASEPAVASRSLDVDIAMGSAADAQVPGGGQLISRFEKAANDANDAAQVASQVANFLGFSASVAGYVPNFSVDATPWGVGGTTSFGGSNVASAIQALVHGAQGLAAQFSYSSRQSSQSDAVNRRQREWAFHSNQAAGEINQIFKQLRAAQIREAIAETEWRNHQRQIANARAVEAFLNADGSSSRGKTSNQAFYSWMKRELKGLYARNFQFAFDAAKKAERALQHELGDPSLSYLQFGYLSGKEGLLAGEKLWLDVKRMDVAYQDLNHREFELTKHVSLASVDPLALVQLRQTGRCTVSLPEALFDLDGPGHYFRRLRSVAVSVPCVTGPFAGVNCTLTLLKSSIRVSPLLRDGAYPRSATGDDPRFSDYYGTLESIVTSSGQNDAGLFETNLRDERYLPFENSGVVSSWQLELPGNPVLGDPLQFDYSTISDVVLSLRFTARQGGSALRHGALAAVRDVIGSAATAGSVRLLSVRHEFPDAWARFVSSVPADGTRFALSLPLSAQLYPFWSRGLLGTVHDLEVVAQLGPGAVAAKHSKVFVSASSADAGIAGELSKSAALGGLLRGQIAEAHRPEAPASGSVDLFFDGNTFDDLWVAITWGK